MSRFFFISQHPMEEETINRIVLAIQTQLSPAATQAQRQEAQQVTYPRSGSDLNQSKCQKIVIIIFFLI
jgi:hypothetical protein